MQRPYPARSRSAQPSLCQPHGHRQPERRRPRLSIRPDDVARHPKRFSDACQRNPDRFANVGPALRRDTASFASSSSSARTSGASSRGKSTTAEPGIQCEASSACDRPRRAVGVGATSSRRDRRALTRHHAGLPTRRGAGYPDRAGPDRTRRHESDAGRGGVAGETSSPT